MSINSRGAGSGGTPQARAECHPNCHITVTEGRQCPHFGPMLYGVVHTSFQFGARA